MRMTTLRSATAVFPVAVCLIAGGAEPAALAAGLLGRHVAGCADDGPGGGQAGVLVGALGQAEVGDARLALGVDQDVGRLEVAVQHAAAVREVDRLGDDADVAHRLQRRQRVFAHQFGQAAALDVIHREVVLPLLLADLVDGDDVGVLEAGGGPGFLLEAAHVGFVGELPAQDHLQGDDAVEADLPRLEHHPHAAAGDLLQQLVVAEVAGGVQHRHGLGEDLFLGHRRDLVRRLRGERGPGAVLEGGAGVEEGGQLLGQVGVARQELVGRQRQAGLQRLEVGCDCLVHPPVALGTLFG
jgi:hypothetical protein